MERGKETDFEEKEEQGKSFRIGGERERREDEIETSIADSALFRLGF